MWVLPNEGAGSCGRERGDEPAPRPLRDSRSHRRSCRAGGKAPGGAQGQSVTRMSPLGVIGAGDDPRSTAAVYISGEAELKKEKKMVLVHV